MSEDYPRRRPRKPGPRRPGNRGRPDRPSRGPRGGRGAPTGTGPRPARDEALAEEQAGSRRAAFSVLADVVLRNVPLQEALAKSTLLPGLSGRDRAFARAVVMATLRRRGQVEDALRPFLERPLPPPARHASLALLMGAAQLMFLRVPPHAAVSTSVDIVARGPGRRWKGLVNAVLREFSRQRSNPAHRQDAARLNTPDWLWESWSAGYGEEVARAIAEAHLVEPPLDVAVREEPEEWARRLGGGLTPLGTVRVPEASGRVEALPGWRKGAWWVQDAAAQLPVQLFGDVRGKRVADLCAAPGGKTLQLAALGAEVTAVESSAARARRIEANLRRTGLAAEVVVADAATWEADAPFDAVLVDAPCTATGTIRRRPDVAYRHTPSDLRGLAVLQDSLLDAAMRLVRPGGAVVYTVCSLEAEEGPRRIRAFARRHPGAEVERVDPAATGLPPELVDADGFLRTLPCHLADEGGMDGFFAARIRRPDA